MKYYTLSGFTQDKYFNVKRTFRTRNDAIRYVFKKYLPDNAQVMEEIFKTKHDVEYVCGYYTRFFISRHTI